MSRQLPSLPNAPAAGSSDAPVGAWLKQRRKALDLTQEQVAACADLSLPTVAKIEAGRRRPSRQVAELLARCLKVPAEQVPAFVQMARAQLNPAAPENHVALPLPSANLPAPLTRLIGREDELAQL